MAEGFSQQELMRLMQYAAGRLGTTPQALQKTFAEKGLDGITHEAGQAAPLTPEMQAAIERLIRDPEQLRALAANPALRALLRSEEE